jgi:hypothetical protein
MPQGLPEIPTVSQILLIVAKIIWEGFRLYWWIVLPPALYFIFIDLWLFYVQSRYIKNISWITLEINVPKEVMKTPKAMEQIFAGLSVIQSGANFIEKWWKGKVQEWISFEIFGKNGTTKFFVRTPAGFKNIIEAQIFAEYPRAEIKEVEDYLISEPQIIPSAEYDLWGTELIFEKDDAYPIKTYPEFEETQEEKRFDPISALLEAIAHLKEGEAVGIQFLIKPAPKDWKEKGMALVNKLIGKKEPPKPLSFFRFVIAFIHDYFTGLMHAALNLPPPEGVAIGTPKTNGGPETKIPYLSPGERLVVEKIEQKLSKIGFSCGIRFIYWGKKQIFSKSNVAAILSYFRQFNTLNLNSLRPNKDVTPSIDYWFKARREFIRKIALWNNYKLRTFPQKAPVLNTEELATLYHFPTAFVESPSVIWIESRKGGPPPTLPIVQ